MFTSLFPIFFNICCLDSIRRSPSWKIKGIPIKIHMHTHIHTHKHTHIHRKMKLERVTWCENIDTPLFTTTPISPTSPFSWEKSDPLFFWKISKWVFPTKGSIIIFNTYLICSCTLLYIYLYKFIFIYIYIYIYLIYLRKSKKPDDSMFHNNVCVFIIIPALLYLLHFAIIT